MNHPFNHSSISNPTGLFILRAENNYIILSYRCSLCSYETNESHKLIQHTKTIRHQQKLQSCIGPEHTSTVLHPPTQIHHDETNVPLTHTSTSYNELYITTDGNDVHYDDTYAPFDSDSIPQHHHGFNLDQASLMVLRKCFNDGVSHYLFYTQQSVHGKGMESLLAKCLLGSEKLYDLISQNECKLHFSLLDLAIDLSLKQREKLITLFKHILIHFSSPESADSVSIPIPISTQELRTRYTRGTNSLWNNIPIPTPKEGITNFFCRKQISFAY